jgi:hypothetical protein
MKSLTQSRNFMREILKISEKSIIEFYVSIIIWINFLSNITLCNVGNESLF